MIENSAFGNIAGKIKVGIDKIAQLDIRAKIEKARELGKAGIDDVWESVRKALADQGQRAKNTITVVYDGKAPYIAARNLCAYIQDMGYKVTLIDTDKYEKGGLAISYGKVIIVGHHKLAKEQEQGIGFLQYDNYGMKFGFCGRCVLRASRSALGRGEKGRKKFSNYYDSRMLCHEELASKYGTPMKFGARGETRKSQYDLLWLEFAAYGLSEFLAGTKTKEEMTAEGSENIAEKAAANLIGQMKADEDMTYTIDELLQNSYKQNENTGMETLRKHLGNDIVFTGVWADAKDQYDLEDSELLEGELSACVFQVGCYAIRSSHHLYQDTEEVHYSKKIPATQEVITSYKESGEDVAALLLMDEVREVHEISAKLHTAGAVPSIEGWKDICLAAASMRWSECVSFIGTVKSNASISDEQAELFVLKTYIGDSFGVDHWYKLGLDGTVWEYQEHPYDPDSFEVSWQGSGKKQAI